MEKRGNRPRAYRFLVILCICISVTLLWSSVSGAWTCSCDQRLCEAFQAALDDSAPPPAADKISRTLTAIIPENDKLIWEDEIPGSRLLVVIYGKGLSPDPGPLPNPSYALRTNKWVTVAPEIFSFFKNKVFTDTRLEQLLGLPPCYGNTTIVELWVDPRDLFRPSPDPEIIDHEASLDFPWKQNRYMLQNTTSLIYDDYCSTPSPCFSTYETWFTNRKAHIYYDSPPYPWTGLGYTYDWGSSQSHVGMSEFVVTPTTVGVVRISDAPDYFRAHNQSLSVSLTGSGTVTSKPFGISCGKTCTKNFSRYAKVTLTATPSSSTRFDGWTGACAHAGTNPRCTVTMVDDKAAEALFVPR